MNTDKNCMPFERRTQALLYVPLKRDIYQYICVISHRAYLGLPIGLPILKKVLIDDRKKVNPRSGNT